MTKVEQSQTAGKAWDCGGSFHGFPHQVPSMRGHICSLSFQFLPKGYNFVTRALPTKPAQTDSELYDCVHGQGM